MCAAPAHAPPPEASEAAQAPEATEMGLIETFRIQLSGRLGMTSELLVERAPLPEMPTIREGVPGPAPGPAPASAPAAEPNGHNSMILHAGGVTGELVSTDRTEALPPSEPAEPTQQTTMQTSEDAVNEEAGWPGDEGGTCCSAMYLMCCADDDEREAERKRAGRIGAPKADEMDERRKYRESLRQDEVRPSVSV